MERRWTASGGRGVYPAEVKRVDGLVDLVLTATRDIAVGQAVGLSPEHPTAVAVDRFLAEVFPNGVAAVTSLPYIEQVMVVELILERLRGANRPRQ